MTITATITASREDAAAAADYINRIYGLKFNATATVNAEQNFKLDVTAATQRQIDEIAESTREFCRQQTIDRDAPRIAAEKAAKAQAAADALNTPRLATQRQINFLAQLYHRDPATAMNAGLNRPSDATALTCAAASDLIDSILNAA